MERQTPETPKPRPARRARQRALSESERDAAQEPQRDAAPEAQRDALAQRPEPDIDVQRARPDASSPSAQANAAAPDVERDANVERAFEASDALGPDERYRLICEAAYSRYVGRGYIDGSDVEDWLEAEREVDQRLARGRGGMGTR